MRVFWYSTMPRHRKAHQPLKPLFVYDFHRFCMANNIYIHMLRSHETYTYIPFRNSSTLFTISHSKFMQKHMKYHTHTPNYLP